MLTHISTLSKKGNNSSPGGEGGSLVGRPVRRWWRALGNLAGSGPAGITQHNPLVLLWVSCLVFLGRSYLLSPPGIIGSGRRFCRGAYYSSSSRSISIYSRPLIPPIHHLHSHHSTWWSNDGMKPLLKRTLQTGFETQFPQAGWLE